MSDYCDCGGYGRMPDPCYCKHDIQKLEAKIQELEEQLRWRKYPEEEPEVGKLYAVEVVFGESNTLALTILWANEICEPGWNRVIRFIPLIEPPKEEK